MPGSSAFTTETTLTCTTAGAVLLTSGANDGGSAPPRAVSVGAVADSVAATAGDGRVVRPARKLQVVTASTSAPALAPLTSRASMRLSSWFQTFDARGWACDVREG